MIGGYISNKTRVYEKKEIKANIMRSEISNKKINRDKYYLNIILDLIIGSNKMGMPVVCLENIEGWYNYYGINDTVVHWNDSIKKSLLKEGISSYTDSSNNLVVTTSEK